MHSKLLGHHRFHGLQGTVTFRLNLVFVSSLSEEERGDLRAAANLRAELRTETDDVQQRRKSRHSAETWLRRRAETEIHDEELRTDLLREIKRKMESLVLVLPRHRNDLSRTFLVSFERMSGCFFGFLQVSERSMQTTTVEQAIRALEAMHGTTLARDYRKKSVRILERRWWGGTRLVDARETLQKVFASEMEQQPAQEEGITLIIVFACMVASRILHDGCGRAQLSARRGSYNTVSCSWSCKLVEGGPGFSHIVAIYNTVALQSSTWRVEDQHIPVMVSFR